MAKQEYEFTLILSGLAELTREVLDAFYEAGCDDALIGMRDGIAYAEICREAKSLREAVLSAIHDVESAGHGARVEHIEPDEFVTMSEIARRLYITREGVRKRVSGERGPGNFPSPAGCLTKRSPLWRWTDVLHWHRTILASYTSDEEPKSVVRDQASAVELGSQIAVLNAVLDLRRRLPFDEAMQVLKKLDWTSPVTGHVEPVTLTQNENGGATPMTEEKSRDDLVAEFWPHLRKYVMDHGDNRVHLVKPNGLVCKSRQRNSVCIEVQLNHKNKEELEVQLLCLEDSEESQFNQLRNHMPDINKKYPGESFNLERMVKRSGLGIPRKIDWQQLNDEAYRSPLMKWILSKLELLLEIWEQYLI
jgi:hypothetical protein